MGVPASHPRWGEKAFAYDLGFAVEPTPPLRISVEGLAVPCKDPKLIGVNVSGLLFQGGYTGRNEFCLRANYRCVQYTIIRALLAQPGTRVLLVPHVLGTEKDGESDAVACKQIYEDLRGQYPDRIGILRGAYSPGEMRAIVGLCGFLVGSRMHACIAALAQSIPAVAVAYSDKFLGVIATLGVDVPVADARTLSCPEIVAVVESAWQARGEIAERLARKMPTIQEAAWNLLTSLEEIVTAVPEMLATQP